MFENRSTVLFGTLLTIVILLLQTSSFNPISTVFKRLDYLFYDMRFQWSLPSHREESQHRIVIVDIDEQSLGEIGQWPWPRQTVAAMLGKIFQSGAVMVAMDIVFAEPERNPTETIIQGLESRAGNNEEITRILRQNSSLFDGDGELANAFSEAEIVTGYLFNQFPNIQTGALPTPLEVTLNPTTQRSMIRSMLGYNANLDQLQSAALSAGFLTIFPDEDGSLRRVPLLLEHQGRIFTSLALEVTRQYLLIDKITPQFQPINDEFSVEGLWLDNRWVPTDEQGQMLIPYRGKRGHFDYISAGDILNDRIKPASLTDALVFIGTSSLGLADLRTTPMGRGFPGVEVQATITDALLSGDIPYSPDWAPGANAALIVCIGLLLSVCLPRFSALGITLISGFCLLSVFVFNSYLWTYQHIHLPLPALIILISTLDLSNTVAGYYVESRQRQKVVDMFGQYVAPAHIEKLLGLSNASQTFAGESKELTVLFADIRSFTKISEQLSATELKQLLNSFFTPMTEIIFDHQGTIDKYVGDMIMAFWGAPLSDEQQEQHAVTSALLMLEKVEELKLEFEAKGLPEVNIGIGINTGVMNVGDMGSIYRRAYTVLGDAVNLGSRLESITKFYGVKCLVSEATSEKISDIVFRCIDHILVVGKEQPIKIFEPCYFAHQRTAILQVKEASFEQARTSYVAQQWEIAQHQWQQHRETFSEDKKLCDIYLERIVQYSQAGVEDDWVGIYRHTSK